MNKKLFQKLYVALLGKIPEERLITDTIRRVAYGTDAGLYRKTPRFVANNSSGMTCGVAKNSQNTGT